MRWIKEKSKLVLPKSQGRSAGLHISEVIRDYAVEASVLDRKWVKETAIEDQDTNMMQVGLAFEDYLGATQHPEIEFHPGELFLDDQDFCMCGHDRDAHKHIANNNGFHKMWDCSISGCECQRFKAHRIYMSPDGISLIDGAAYPHLFRKCGNFLHEFKFTKKSSRDFVDLLNQQSPKTLMWQWQIQCYCMAMGTLAAKLHVMFINGDYSRKEPEPGTSSAPYEIFRGEFTEEDIEKNWNKFKQHARHMRINRMVVA
jgi:hypothetical protein